MTFHTARVGDVRRTTTLAMVYIGEKDKGVWKIDWSPTDILPNLTPGRLVRMTRVNTTRGRGKANVSRTSRSERAGPLAAR